MSGFSQAGRCPADRRLANGELPLLLAFVGEVDWDAMLGYLAARAIAGVEHVSGGTYRRTVLVKGDPGVIEVTSGGANRLLLTAHLPHCDGLTHVVHQVRRLFNLDTDVRAANRALAPDALLAGRIAMHPGVRVPGAWDPFEIGVRAIIGQQVTVAGAGTITARLVQRHGRAVPGLDQFGLTHLFPPADVLVGADLAGLGLTEARIQAIRNFATAVAEGSVSLDRCTPLEDQVTALVAIRGLGPWTAHYLALRMGEPDAFPSTDLGLRRSIESITRMPVAPSEVARLAEQWRPWRAHAAIHLWLATPSTGDRG